MNVKAVFHLIWTILLVILRLFRIVPNENDGNVQPANGVDVATTSAPVTPIPSQSPTLAPMALNTTTGPTFMTEQAINATNVTGGEQISLFPLDKMDIDSACSRAAFRQDNGALCEEACGPQFYKCCDPFDEFDLYNFTEREVDQGEDSTISTSTRTEIDERNITFLGKYDDIDASQCSFDQNIRGCMTYAKCQALSGQIVPAPANLPDMCSFERLERDEDSCRSLCSNLECCYSMGSDNCLAEKFDLCMDYAPCHNLRIFEEGISAAQILQTAPRELDYECAWAQPKCAEYCDTAYCCSNPGAGSCYQFNFMSCLTYSPCTANAETETEILIPPQFSHVEKPPMELIYACNANHENILEPTEKNCAGYCEAASCCFAEGDANCFHKDPLGCVAWSAQCQVLASPVVPNFVTPAPIAPKHTDGPTISPSVVKISGTGGPSMAPQQNSNVPIAMSTEAPNVILATTKTPATTPSAAPTAFSTTQPTPQPQQKQTANPTQAPVKTPTESPVVSTSTNFPVAMTSPTTGIDSFVLIYAPTDEELLELEDGDAIDMQTLDGVTDLAFNVKVNPSSGVGVVFFPQTGRREQTPPLAFCGDNAGDYNACTEITAGTNTITATPFEAVTNVELPTISISFEIVGAPSSAGNGGDSGVVPGDGADATFVGKWIEIDPDADIEARHEACFVMVDNPTVGRRAVLIGGRGMKRTDIFDPVSRSWSMGPTTPAQLHHIQCVAAQGLVWIMSAWTDWYPRENNAEFVYVFDPASNEWSTRTAMPESRRRGAAAVIVSPDEQTIWVSHGNNGGHETEDHAESLGYLDAYDIATDTWTALSDDAPNPRDHTGGAFINGRICVGGGRNGGELNWPEVPATDCYDLATGMWTEEAPIPDPRAGSSYGVSCDGKLLVAGGEGGGKAWNEVHAFDGSQWSAMAPLNIGRHGSGLAVDCVCDQIIIASGAASQGGGPEITSVEIYFPDGQENQCFA